MKKLLAVAVFVALLAVGAQAKESPIKLSLWGPIAIPSGSVEVKGLDLGIGSTTPKMTGLQFDFIYAESSDFTGLQMAIVNNVGSGTGVQWSAVNIVTEDFTGLQAGFVNYANRVTGLQLGFVNYAKVLDKGLQLGLVNFAENGWLPVMIFINGKF